MYNTFQKTQKITFTSNKVMIIDVVRHLHPCEGKRQRSPRQRENPGPAYQEGFRSPEKPLH